MKSQLTFLIVFLIPVLVFSDEKQDCEDKLQIKPTFAEYQEYGCKLRCDFHADISFVNLAEGKACPGLVGTNQTNKVYIRYT